MILALIIDFPLYKLVFFPLLLQIAPFGTLNCLFAVAGWRKPLILSHY
jgi:hypothetical protein